MKGHWHEHLYQATTDGDERCVGTVGVCSRPIRRPGEPDPKPVNKKRSGRVRQYQHTSRAAFESMLPHLATVYGAVLSIISLQPSTSEEVQHALDGKHQTVSAAVSALWHDYELIQPMKGPLGTRRTTSGRKANVMEVVPGETHRVATFYADQAKARRDAEAALDTLRDATVQALPSPGATDLRDPRGEGGRW